MASDITPTAIAAWWGATIATLVFLWDIYKWRQAGARIRLTVSPNMEHMGVIPNWVDPNQTLVAVEAVNVGNKKTTITHMFACYFPSRWARLRRKSTRTLLVGLPSGNQPLPHELDPGARWIGAMVQNQELEELSRSGYLCVGIHHSMANRGLLVRLVIPA
ncbi:MAG: hypothetical protein WA373_13980 [Burkholderiales bacterium]